MIVSAAFVPSTPLLVPEVGAGAAYELDDARDAADTVVREAVSAGVERVVILGSVPPAGAGDWPYAATTSTYARGTGTLRGFGVALDIDLDPRGTDPQPLSLASTLGAWLLARAGWEGDRLAVELAPDADDVELDSMGRALADGVATALVVVADGSAARSDKAPASLHPDAEAFDAAVASALASGDPAALADLDRERAAAVVAAGRPAWRAAAAALAGTAYDAQVRCDVAPYGVGYLVADWTRRA